MSNKMQRYTVYFIWKLLYVFRVVPPLIIRSANSCIYSIWYLSHRYCYLPLSWKSCNWFERQGAVTVWQIPDTVDTVVCGPNDEWWYHLKHVEQFPDKINCVTLQLVGYILEYLATLFSHDTCLAKVSNVNTLCSTYSTCHTHWLAVLDTTYNCETVPLLSAGVAKRLSVVSTLLAWGTLCFPMFEELTVFNP